MQIRTLLLGSAAAAVLATAVAPLTALDLGLATSAQAQDAYIGFSVFYDDLAPYGDWVAYRNAFVFIPANVGPGWRPYTEGHWVHTQEYGWLWVSDEDFGWATYHYGRWGYDDEIGWYWVPGRQWAPAWVSWKRGRDHVVWAPLPPSGDDDISIDVSIGSIPDYYWVAVPARSFLQINLRVVIIDNDRERRRIVREARDEGRVRVRNNIAVNNIIDVNFIEQRTGKKVRNLEVRRSEKPGRARDSGEAVTVFTGNVEPSRDKKPGKLKKLEDVKRIRASERPADDQATSGQPAVKKKKASDRATGVPQSGDQAGQPVVKKKKASDQTTGAEPNGDATQPAVKKKKASGQATGQQPNADVKPPAAKKRKAGARAAGEQPGGGNTTQPLKKKKAGAQAGGEQPDGGKGAQPLKQKKPSAQTTGKKPARKNGKGAPKCDPNTADCPS